MLKIASEEENARLAFIETSRINNEVELQNQVFLGGYELDAKILSDLESLQTQSI